MSFARFATLPSALVAATYLFLYFATLAETGIFHGLFFSFLAAWLWGVRVAARSTDSGKSDAEDLPAFAVVALGAWPVGWWVQATGRGDDLMYELFQESVPRSFEPWRWWADSFMLLWMLSVFACHWFAASALVSAERRRFGERRSVLIALIALLAPPFGAWVVRPRALRLLEPSRTMGSTQ